MAKQYATVRLVVVMLTCAAALVAAPSGVEARKRFTVESFEAQAQVEPGGSLLVVERSTFRFEGGPFTETFRTFRRRRVDAIEVIEAGVDGRALPFGAGPNEVEISGRSDITVTWRFDPVSDTTRTFTLRYRLRGVVEQRKRGDALRWSVLPHDRSYSIGDVRVFVTLPPRAPLLEEPSAPFRRSRMEVSSESVSVRAADVRKDRALVMSLVFPPGSLIDAPPGWQVRRLEELRYAPIFVALAATIAVAGIAGLLVLALGRRRPPVAPTGGSERTTPPDDLPVAVAGAILQPGARPSWPQALGTLFDVAQRGLIRIEETPGRRGKSEFSVVLVSRPGDLRAHERALVSHLFEDRGPGASTQLSRLTRLHGKFGRFSRPLKEEMRLAGLIDEERSRVQRNFRKAGIASVIAAVVLLLSLAFAVPVFGPWPLLVGVAFAVVGVTSLVIASVFSPLSDRGAWHAAEWRAFASYLKGLARGRHPIPDLAVLERYLPHAATFGATSAWAKRMKADGGAAALPAWFKAIADGEQARAALAAALVVVIASSSTGAGGGVSAGGAGSGAR
jgi:hypothetical protein